MRREIQQFNQIDKNSQKYYYSNKNNNQNNSITLINCFRAANLEFFYLDIPKSYRSNNISFANKKIIYREIFIFVEQIKNYTTII